MILQKNWKKFCNSALFTQLEIPHGIADFDYNGTNTGELSFQVTSKSIHSHYWWFCQCQWVSVIRNVSISILYSLQKNEVLVLLEELDSKNFECQVGNAKGTVRKTHMKIITPLTDLPNNPVPQVISSWISG